MEAVVWAQGDTSSESIKKPISQHSDLFTKEVDGSACLLVESADRKKRCRMEE